jgi:hypothetical protein
MSETAGEGRKRSRAKALWGPRVSTSRLQDRFAPQEVEPFTVPRGGIDNLGLHSTDVFSIPEQGEFTVDFKGFFRVARDHPTSEDWTTAEVLVNIVELKLYGGHERLGDITVSLNPDILATGQIFPAQGPAGPKACRIATPAVFDVPQLGASLFNKEPILLMNRSVVAIPPVNDPNGHALLFRLPLFDRDDPNGTPRAYLTSLRYGADHYLEESQVQARREGSPR